MADYITGGPITLGTTERPLWGLRFFADSHGQTPRLQQLWIIERGFTHVAHEWRDVPTVIGEEETK